LQDHHTTSSTVLQQATARANPRAGKDAGALYKASASPMLDGAEVADFEAQSSDLAPRSGSILLDYLRVRLDDTPATWLALRDWLGETTPRAGGWRGWYDGSSQVLDGGILAWCSHRERAAIEGILVDLPGAACAALGDRLLAFLAWSLEHGRVARADFALDDRDGHLTKERILEAEETGGLVSRWQGLTLIERRKRGQSDGWTVYIGSRQSEASLRIYDKAAEQRARGREVAGHWVRLELEAKGAFADALCREVLSRGTGAVIGQINKRIRFAEPSATDTNTRRWSTCSWWLAFIGSIEPGRSLLCGERMATTIESLARFVERAAGPALATLVRADVGDLTRLFGIIDRSQHRMRPRHLAALAMA